MSAGPVQLQPDEEAVLQEEAPEDYPLPVVQVCVTDVKPPVRTKQLPNVAGSTKTRTIGASTPVPVLTADHRRAVAILCSFDQDLLFSFTETGAQDPSTMSRQPKGVPIRLTTNTDVWVLAQTATTAVSITTERWAAGE